jgi:murein DD-endopeptidase MepM/ murein hydrolase activator NlpD
MTLYSIAKANGLTVSKLAAANKLKPPYAVRQGQMLRIPGVEDAVTPAPKTAEITDDEAPVKTPFKTVASAKSGNHEVAPGDTLFSLGRKYGVSPYAIADANGLAKNAGLKLGQSLKIPGASAKTETELVAAVEEKPAGEIAAPKQEVAENTATPDTQKTVSPEQPVQMADAGAAGFRWPVRGKIISEFGAKPNGLKNEGINISVPEGTSVRAAGDGVVAYAGNELKGYGNLVLVRHAGGWVTAYAHAKELFVKRGDTVKRGDVIAKAGQTGSVSSPQLHFEVRKGAVAMDPLKYLDQATASN